MIDSIQNILVQVSDFLWSYIIITILICCAVFFTWRTRFVQFRLIREMVRLLLHPDKVQPEEIGQEELSMDVKVDGEMKHISSFQAFVVALASRIGTGNLAGVATAISIGGPGAVFWMWMLALLGSASAFIESTLAQLYKRKGKTSFYGGPAYYMKYGLGKGWMGILFAVLMIITFGFAYNSVQSNTICLAWQKAFGIEPATMGIILTALTLLIIFGGIQRVAKFSSTVVPVMAVVYLLIAVGVVIWNITSLPKVLLIIIENAFGFNQAAYHDCYKRISDASDFVGQGILSQLDTIGCCDIYPAHKDDECCAGTYYQGIREDTQRLYQSLFYRMAHGSHRSSIRSTTLAGLIAEQASLDALDYCDAQYSACIFAFSSIIGNYYYGETNVRYIKDSRLGVFIYRLAVAAMVMIGAIVSLDFAWSFADITMALLTLCNLAAIVLLSRQAVFLLQDYRQQKKEGKNPVFNKEKMPEIADKLEAW